MQKPFSHLHFSVHVLPALVKIVPSKRLICWEIVLRTFFIQYRCETLCFWILLFHLFLLASHVYLRLFEELNSSNIEIYTYIPWSLEASWVLRDPRSFPQFKKLFVCLFVYWSFKQYGYTHVQIVGWCKLGNNTWNVIVKNKETRNQSATGAKNRE